MANGPIDYSKLLNAQQQYLKNQTEIAEATGKIYSDAEKASAGELVALEQNQELLRATFQTQEGLLQQAIELEDKANNSLKLNTQEKEIMRQRAKALFDIATLKEKELETVREILKTEIKTTIEKEKQKKLDDDAQKKMDGSVKKLAAMVGFGTKFEDTMTGAFTNMLSGSGSLVKSLKELDVGGFLASNFEQLAMGTDKLTSGFVKGTGATGGLAGAVQSGADGLRQMGLGMDSVFQAADSLTDGITAFQTGTRAAQEDLSLFFGVLVKAGIGGPGATKAFQIFNMGMGMSAEASKAATIEMVQFGRALNMNVNAFMADFNALAPTLIAHGDKMEQVFKELAVTSQQTGISMQNLMGVSQQFDTFESAASSTAKLNSILGGAYLNSVEMVFATESERLLTLQKTLSLSGKSFDDLGRFEKKALAAAGGFSSVAEASNFFNASLEVNTAQMEEQAEKQETMEKLARRAADVMEELTMAIQGLFINLEPLVGAMSKFVGMLASILSIGGGSVGMFLAISVAVGKLAVSMKALGIASRIVSRTGIGAAIGLGALGIGALVSANFGGSDSGPKGFATGKSASLAAGPDMGGGMTMATVHANETIAMPRYGTTVHNASQSAQFATKKDMNNVASAITNGLASVANGNNGNIILDGKVLGEYVDGRGTNQLAIFNTT